MIHMLPVPSRRPDLGSLSVVLDRLDGLTASMYSIARNVIIPPLISVRISEPLSDMWKKSSILVDSSDMFRLLVSITLTLRYLLIIWMLLQTSSISSFQNREPLDDAQFLPFAVERQALIPSEEVRRRQSRYEDDAMVYEGIILRRDA